MLTGPVHAACKGSPLAATGPAWTLLIKQVHYSGFHFSRRFHHAFTYHAQASRRDPRPGRLRPGRQRQRRHHPDRVHGQPATPGSLPAAVRTLPETEPQHQDQDRDRRRHQRGPEPVPDHRPGRPRQHPGHLPDRRGPHRHLRRRRLGRTARRLPAQQGHLSESLPARPHRRGHREWQAVRHAGLHRRAVPVLPQGPAGEAQGQGPQDLG